jgi:WD40 repeat protein
MEDWLGDARMGEVEKTLRGHARSVYAVAFSPDGGRIASGSLDRTVKVWDARTGEVERTLTGHSSFVLAVAFSPSEERIASGSTDRTIKVWDLRVGAVEITFNLPSHSTLMGLSAVFGVWHTYSVQRGMF